MIVYVLGHQVVIQQSSKLIRVTSDQSKLGILIVMYTKTLISSSYTEAEP